MIVIITSLSTARTITLLADKVEATHLRTSNGTPIARNAAAMVSIVEISIGRF